MQRGTCRCAALVGRPEHCAVSAATCSSRNRESQLPIRSTVRKKAFSPRRKHEKLMLTLSSGSVLGIKSAFPRRFSRSTFTSLLLPPPLACQPRDRRSLRSVLEPSTLLHPRESPQFCEKLLSCVLLLYDNISFYCTLPTHIYIIITTIEHYSLNKNFYKIRESPAGLVKLTVPKPNATTVSRKA